MASAKGRIKFDVLKERIYESGVSQCVLFPTDSTGKYATGVAWNGVINISEKPTGAEPKPLYADNIKYAELTSAEEFKGSIEAYMYPDEFAACDGSAELVPGVSIGQQTRSTFALAYTTKKGNAEAGIDAGYVIHLIYGCKAAPTEKQHATINDSPDAATFTWELTTTPVVVDGFKPTATIDIDSTKVNKEKLKAFEDILYGKDAGSTGSPAAVDSRLPLPDEVKTLLTSA